MHVQVAVVRGSLVHAGNPPLDVVGKPLVPNMLAVSPPPPPPNRYACPVTALVLTIPAR